MEMCFHGQNEQHFTISFKNKFDWTNNLINKMNGVQISSIRQLPEVIQMEVDGFEHNDPKESRSTTYSSKFGANDITEALLT